MIGFTVMQMSGLTVDLHGDGNMTVEIPVELLLNHRFQCILTVAH